MVVTLPNHTPPTRRRNPPTLPFGAVPLSLLALSRLVSRPMSSCHVFALSNVCQKLP